MNEKVNTIIRLYLLYVIFWKKQTAPQTTPQNGTTSAQLPIPIVFYVYGHNSMGTHNETTKTAYFDFWYLVCVSESSFLVFDFDYKNVLRMYIFTLQTLEHWIGCRQERLLNHKAMERKRLKRARKKKRQS